MFNVMDFGARGDGTGNDSEAIRKAITACSKAGGGRVVIPSGRVCRCGPVKLASHIELHLETGARLEAIPDIKLYPEYGLSPEHLGNEGQKWIHAENAEFVSVTGGGIIDGKGVKWMKSEEKYRFRMDPGRPFLINFENCAHVTLRDITLRDAPFWTVHLLGCNDVLAQGVRILNNLKLGNSDGINPDRCKNVRIIGCHIEAADDCICLKSEEAIHEEKYGACENIIISDCTLVSTSCAIKLGTGTFGAIKNVLVSNCAISRTNRGLGLVMRDGGSISDVLFSNITIETRLFEPNWWGAGEPIYITAFSRKENKPAGTIKNIKFHNIHCKSENGIYLAAQAPADIQNILFEGVSVELAKTSRHEGGYYDRRPCFAEGKIKHPTSGFFISNAENVAVRNCGVEWGKKPPEYYRHALEAENAPGLELTGLKGLSAFPEKYEPVRIVKI